jgi:hypothetical protein
MSISHNTLYKFQTKANDVLKSLAREFSMIVVQKDEMAISAIGELVEVCLYIYPSHIPNVNITLRPKGAQWEKWRLVSKWGSNGIWLIHLAAFHNKERQYPDTHFKTDQELNNHIEVLINILRDLGIDILKSDQNALARLVEYADSK